MAAGIQKSGMDSQDMRGLLYSIVSAFTKAIDERTPYNASHTMQVAKHVSGMLAFMRVRYEADGRAPVFSPDEEEQIVMAAYLHDVGKLVVPLDVMNKANRLGRGGIERIHDRYLLLKACLDIEQLRGRLEEDECQRQKALLDELEARIVEADRKPVLSRQEISYFEEIGKRSFCREDGMVIPWLTSAELRNLRIEKGTLNVEERRIMEYHAVATEKILKEIRFGTCYDKVTEIASAHHEFLDGSGYPEGLSGDRIPAGTRLLTIADIYDSLIATDRPYKKPMDMADAREILLEMAREGKLDEELTVMFCEYLGTL